MYSELINAALGVLGEFPLRGDNSAASAAAAIQTVSGSIYTGVCLDTTCGLGFCAEHSAVAEMLKHRETKVALMVAVGSDKKVLPPCGRCRELLLQLDEYNSDTLVILASSRALKLSDLLPKHWLECFG